MSDFDNILATAMQQTKEQTPLYPQESTIALEVIQDRAQDTRQLNQKHIESLADSIAVLGLIEPLVLDNKARLLAGGHRLAAIRLLKEKQLEAYQQHFPNELVPIRILPFDADEDTGLALQVEIAENEQRKDYTPTEVKAIANRLREAGYVEVKGRPKKDQKPLMPALAVVVGKHLRTVQRYLESNEKPVEEKSAAGVVLLKQALNKLEEWGKIQPETKTEEALAEALPEFMSLIAKVLEEEKHPKLKSVETIVQ